MGFFGFIILIFAICIVFWSLSIQDVDDEDENENKDDLGDWS